MWARGNPPLSLYFPTYYISFSILYFYPFSLSYLRHLYSCCFIPSHTTTIVPLYFQAGCRRMQLNLTLVFCADFMLYVFLVKDACLFLSYLI